MRRILFVVFVGLIIGILGSCSAQPGASEDAPREDNVGREAAAQEETTEPAVSTTVADPKPRPTANTESSPATGSSGMVSSAHPLATRAGLEVLDEGGNAFDAAVAVAAALNVVEPMMSGIGGYGAIVIYDAEKRETRFLAPGNRTPAALDPAVFQPPAPDYLDNRCGVKTISTPGNLDAWEALSEEYGELEWSRLFGPAIRYAEEGFALDEISAGWISSEYPAFPAHAQEIYGRNGAPLSAGEFLVQEDLARSLTLIAEEGAGTVNGGELGETIASSVQQDGGSLSVEDLQNNEAEWLETMSIDYLGNEVVTAAPPSTAWSALLRLGAMGQFDFEPQDYGSVPYLHAFTEITRLSAPSFAGGTAEQNLYAANSPEDLEQVLTEDYWAGLAAQVDPSQARPYEQPEMVDNATTCSPTGYTPTNATAPPGADSQHTTHFVVADREGNVVSATQTLGNVFGSKVMPEGTGIWLNDALAWSRFEPADNNVFGIYPGRQNRYALAPTIVLRDGRPIIALGTPGGRTITQITPQMLMNVIDFEMDIQQAISAPRTSYLRTGYLMVESSVPQPVRDGLASLGHELDVNERGFGNAHGLTIEYDDRGRPVRFTGGADPRGVGAAIGY